MSTQDLQLAEARTKRLEQLLVEHYGATGRSLHGKLTSVEDRVPEHVTRKLRFVATVTNRIRRDPRNEAFDDRPGFLRASREAERKLAGTTRHGDRVHTGFVEDQPAEPARRAEPGVAGAAAVADNLARVGHAVHARLAAPAGPLVEGGQPSRRLWLTVLAWLAIGAVFVLGGGTILAAAAGVVYVAGLALTALATAVAALFEALVQIVMFLLLLVVLGGGLMAIGSMAGKR